MFSITSLFLLLNLVLIFVPSILALPSNNPAFSPRQTKPRKPYQLRGVQSPIFHLYLQTLPSSKSTSTPIPVMGPESTSEYFTIGNTIQSVNSSLYLNIGEKVDGRSYLPLSFAKTANTTAWGLEGDTVITVTGSAYGRRKYFFVYLLFSMIYCWYRVGFVKSLPGSKILSLFRAQLVWLVLAA
ncbi:hypothetical protein ONS96_006185 [Cadophora gregata f. sp. sojae]|nr:hypothetical protein ONS96_006185 [Cadophora gregata f. sp. sojae]